MARYVESPTVTHEDGAMGGTRLQHPAFGQIAVSRVSGHAVLYGSDFVHQHSVRLRISTSSLRRDLSHDWPFADREFVEVEMSEAQWASFVSSFNLGSGVQCTIRQRDGKMIPGFPLRDEASEFDSEMSENSKVALTALNRAVAAVAEAKISKKDADRILSGISKAAQEIGVNSDYVQQRFGEHMEKRVHKARVEIDAYFHNVIRNAGLKALGVEMTNVIGTDHEE